jgi:hypothetical protein
MLARVVSAKKSDPVPREMTTSVTAVGASNASQLRKVLNRGHGKCRLPTHTKARSPLPSSANAWSVELVAAEVAEGAVTASGSRFLFLAAQSASQEL